MYDLLHLIQRFRNKLSELQKKEGRSYLVLNDFYLLLQERSPDLLRIEFIWALDVDKDGRITEPDINKFLGALRSYIPRRTMADDTTYIHAFLFHNLHRHFQNESEDAIEILVRWVLCLLSTSAHQRSYNIFKKYADRRPKETNITTPKPPYIAASSSFDDLTDSSDQEYQAGRAPDRSKSKRTRLQQSNDNTETDVNSDVLSEDNGKNKSDDKESKNSENQNIDSSPNGVETEAQGETKAPLETLESGEDKEDEEDDDEEEEDFEASAERDALYIVNTARPQSPPPHPSCHLSSLTSSSSPHYPPSHPFIPNHPPYQSHQSYHPYGKYVTSDEVSQLHGLLRVAPLWSVSAQTLLDMMHQVAEEAGEMPLDDRRQDEVITLSVLVHFVRPFVQGLAGMFG